MIPTPSAIRDDQRAVSETLGYILVFSIIITTISTATVFGFNGLEDRQAAEQVTNVERAFDVLRDNFGDISRYEDPSRATEIRLAGGTVSVGESVTVTVGQWDTGTDSFVTENTTNVTLEPLVYRSDGGTVFYEAGVVFRGDDRRHIARSPLPFVVGEETATVPITVTSLGSETTGVGGERTVRIVGKRQPNIEPLANRTVDAGPDELAVRIESPRADGWVRMLRNEEYTIHEESTDSVTAGLPVDRARLPVTRIELRFE